jgi:repressor LexA
MRGCEDMGMAERIKERRVSMNLTQDELAKKLGLQKSAIAKYENGRVENIKRSVIAEMAKILECSPAYLMGWENNTPSQGGVTINVLGRVAAGIPIEAVTDIIDTEEITIELASTGEFFGLQIHGDSMEPKISDGDVVIVRQQEDAESGDIVIALVNGQEATCKRLKKYQNGIMLLSTNTEYEPLVFSDEEVQEKPVRIIGKVVELRAKF